MVEKCFSGLFGFVSLDSFQETVVLLRHIQNWSLIKGTSEECEVNTGVSLCVQIIAGSGRSL